MDITSHIIGQMFPQNTSSSAEALASDWLATQKVMTKATLMNQHMRPDKDDPNNTFGCKICNGVDKFCTVGQSIADMDKPKRTGIFG